MRTFTRGEKLFELSNHLGNVLSTISDRRVQKSTGGVNVDYYTADLVTANDYFPFGFLMPSRNYNAGTAKDYRYGFNGKENDNDVKGEGNQQDYGMRVYDPRLGRFLSVDPLSRQYPWYTPYQYAGNIPIRFIDRDGKEPDDPWDDLWAGKGDQVQNLQWVIKDFFVGRGNSKAARAADNFTRNINPVGVVWYNGWQIATGDDFDTQKPAWEGRLGGVKNLLFYSIAVASGERFFGMFKAAPTLEAEMNLAQRSIKNLSENESSSLGMQNERVPIGSNLTTLLGKGIKPSAFLERLSPINGKSQQYHFDNCMIGSWDRDN